MGEYRVRNASLLQVPEQYRCPQSHDRQFTICWRHRPHTNSRPVSHTVALWSRVDPNA